jgi:hypothetical protein
LGKRALGVIAKKTEALKILSTVNIQYLDARYPETFENRTNLSLDIEWSVIGLWDFGHQMVKILFY